MTAHTAQRFVEQLEQHRSAAEQEKIQRYFKTGEGQYGAGDPFIGVRMGQVFALSKEFEDMPLDEVEALLDSPIHEARAGALKIMVRQAARKRATEEDRAALFALYLRRLDRINNWDLVDLAAWDVVGRHLADKPREVLYELARSEDVWARRTAILATMHFVRHGELDDTFALPGPARGDDAADGAALRHRAPRRRAASPLPRRGQGAGRPVAPPGPGIGLRTCARCAR